MLADLGALISALRDVRFVAIGGVAVAAHGYIRATQDLDIVPDPEAENVTRLLHALRVMNARLSANPTRGMSDPGVLSALQNGRNLTLTTDVGDLDVVQRLTGVPPWAALARRAETTSLGDVTFRVCAREDLLAMKRARAGAQDLADIEALTQGA